MLFLLCVCLSVFRAVSWALSPAASVRAALWRLPEETPHSPLPKFTALSNGANLLREEKASFRLGWGGGVAGGYAGGAEGEGEVSLAAA